MPAPMITVVPYREQWPQEFLKIGHLLRQRLGGLALRIDHIGSTAVPGLAAKDIIDIQITAAALSPLVEETLHQMGYARIETISADHIPPGKPGLVGEWEKWVFKAGAGKRPTNIHVRLADRPNQRYTLLFRDYLRADAAAAQAYAQVKSALAKYHADDLDAYYDVKDRVCDIVMVGAESWAAAAHWEVGPSDC
jgi:GrpB-like predicted nucleotidyltransferase (UPF0157 family)